MNGKRSMMLRTIKFKRRAGWLAAVAAAAILAPALASAGLPNPVQFGVAIENGDKSAAKEWLDEGLPPDFLADRIGTGLMIAAWEGNIPMMEVFLRHGANINQVNAKGEQAVMLAAWKGRLEAVKWLLDRGAQINRSGLQWSALHYAVFNGHEDVAKLLIARGADINGRSTNGSSPLMMAAREGKDDLAKLLVSLGADTTIKNDWGDDALTWAMRNGNIHIAKMVASPERFAEAAKRPRDSFGPVTRSSPVPSSLDQLIEQMRVAAANGGIPPELQQAYLAAVKDLRSKPAPASVAAVRPDVPAALEIRARRDEPAREQAVLIYDSAPAPKAFSAEAPGADAPVQR